MLSGIFHFYSNFNRTFCKQTLIRRRVLHINTFEQYHDTGMQNDEWALPRKYLWQSRCHRVAHMLKCIRTRFHMEPTCILERLF